MFHVIARLDWRIPTHAIRLHRLLRSILTLRCCAGGIHGLDCVIWLLRWVRLEVRHRMAGRSGRRGVRRRVRVRIDDGLRILASAAHALAIPPISVGLITHSNAARGTCWRGREGMRPIQSRSSTTRVRSYRMRRLGDVRGSHGMVMMQRRCLRSWGSGSSTWSALGVIDSSSIGGSHDRACSCRVGRVIEQGTDVVDK